MIAVVAHDAGGAELVGHYLRNAGVTAFATLAGPALRVFEQLRVPIVAMALEEAVSTADWVLCGTSWQSDLEWRAMRHAQLSGRRVVAFLDHWSEYADRFVRRGEIVRPDEVWVADDYAKVIALQALPNVPIVVVGNPYLDTMEAEACKRGFIRRRREEARVILMLPEATMAHAQARYGDPRHFGYTEIEAAEYFLSRADHVFPQIERIIVRPHPAEPAGKYHWVQARSRWPVTVEIGPSLLDHLLAADGVAGCNTMAMVAALRVGRPTVCYIPPGGPKCALPHQEVIMLREFERTG